MLDARLMLRDSVLAAAILVVGAALFRGVDAAAGVAGGAGLALGNLYVLSRLIARLTEGQASIGPLALGLLLKAVGGLGLLVVLLSWLSPEAVMVGVSTVVFAVTVRGLLGLARPTQEA